MSEPSGVGIALPQAVGTEIAEAGELSAYARRAEALGFDSLWVCELLTTRLLDPLASLTFCAAVTDRIGLGVAVLLTDLRSPLHLARETATVDQLSEGRLTVGVGLGSNRAVYPAFGIPAEGRVARFEEGIGLLKELWRGGLVSHGGSWQLEHRNLTPRPVQTPHPPLWFGARSVPALQRAVRLGDGWIGSGSEALDTFAASAAELPKLLEEAQRDPSDFATAKRVYLAVGDDEAALMARAREWFGTHYGKPGLADKVMVAGSPARCAEGLDAVRAAGADLLVVNPIFDEREQMERLAGDVVPLLTTRPNQ